MAFGSKKQAVIVKPSFKDKLVNINTIKVYIQWC